MNQCLGHAGILKLGALFTESEAGHVIALLGGRASCGHHLVRAPAS